MDVDPRRLRLVLRRYLSEGLAEDVVRELAGGRKTPPAPTPQPSEAARAKAEARLKAMGV